MENIQSFIHYILHSNVINFIIMLWILYAIIKKLNLSFHFDDAIKKVNEEMQNSEDKKETAHKNFIHTMEMVKNLPNEIQEIETNANEKIRALELSIQNDTERQKANIDLTVQKTLSSEKQKIYTNITVNTVKLAVDKAEENIINELKVNTKLHDLLIENSIKELDAL